MFLLLILNIILKQILSIWVKSSCITKWHQFISCILKKTNQRSAEEHCTMKPKKKKTHKRNNQFIKYPAWLLTTHIIWEGKLHTKNSCCNAVPWQPDEIRKLGRRTVDQLHAVWGLTGNDSHMVTLLMQQHYTMQKCTPKKDAQSTICVNSWCS